MPVAPWSFEFLEGPGLQEAYSFAIGSRIDVTIRG
jgi:hypothetical protein